MATEFVAAFVHYILQKNINSTIGKGYNYKNKEILIGRNINLFISDISSPDTSTK